MRNAGIREDFYGCSMAKQSPSQKTEIFASPLYTKGPCATGRSYLRVRRVREEQRAMPVVVFLYSVRLVEGDICPCIVDRTVV